MLSEEQRLELKNKIVKHAECCLERIKYCTTEEATKQSLVLPFISTLGYDIFDTSEVVPEYSTGFSDKNKGRVDYVIVKNQKPSIAIECKSVDTTLAKIDKGQLKEYFNSCESVKLGILTNGIKFEFYTDCKQPNMMDDTPFLTFDFEKINQTDGVSDELVSAISRFVKTELDPNHIKEEAKKKLIVSAIMDFWEKSYNDPSNEFVKFILSNTNIFGAITKKAINDYKKTITNTMNLFIKSKIRERMSINANREAEKEILESANGIITTKNELSAYNYTIKRLAFLVDTEELYKNLDGIYYKDYKTTFVVYYKQIIEGRLFNFKELSDGKMLFHFPVLKKEIITSNFKDIDEALLTSYKIRLTNSINEAKKTETKI